MKRTSVLLALWFGVLGPGFLVSAEKGKFEKFTIKKVDAKCEVQLPESGEWKEVKKDEQHQAGVMGRTGASGQMKVEFDKKNSFILMPNSTVKISAETRSASFQKVLCIAKVEKGAVKVDLEEVKEGDKVGIQTPTAVCGAVGTKFVVAVGEDTGDPRKGTFACSQGEVQVAPTNYENERYDAFVANVGPGSTLIASVSPGQDNAHTKLETSGEAVAMDFGKGKEDPQFSVSKGSVIELAQPQEENTGTVALRVREGKLTAKEGDEAKPHTSGRYLYDGGEVLDVAKSDKPDETREAFDDYLRLAQVEGDRRADVARKPGDAAAADALNKAAEKATEARNKLFGYRDVIRKTIRAGQNIGRNLPTRVGGGGSSGSPSR